MVCRTGPTSMRFSSCKLSLVAKWLATQYCTCPEFLTLLHIQSLHLHDTEAKDSEVMQLHK